MSKCLLIFTRNPELGKVKTRLAKGVGDANALTIYKRLLEHTKETVQPIDCVKRVGYSVKVRSEDLWDDTIFEKFQQKGEDLGIRMKNAFKQAFDLGHMKVVIIGSDLYDLRQTHIEKAFETLETKDVVVGPALDGGYYLLGLSQLIPSIFENKKWGTDSVLKDTLDDLQTYSVGMLETLNDIDYAEDLKSYPEFAHYLKE